MALNDKVTILVCSCDDYEDLWYPFFKLLKTQWPDLSCPIILNTESKIYNYKDLDIKCYQLGKVLYGQRMLNHLDKVTTPYTLLLMDDFFIRRPVDSDEISAIIKYMESHPETASFIFNVNQFSKGPVVLSHYYKVNKYAPYKLNMQAGIWRTNILKKYWSPKDDPWRWEIFANFKAFNDVDLFYSVDKNENSPIVYGYNDDGMGVFRGKWVEKDVCPLFEEYNIDVDFNKRGFYNSETAIQRFPIANTLVYIFQRLPFKYAIGYVTYETIKLLCALFKVKLKCRNYTEYLSVKFQ